MDRSEAVRTIREARERQLARQGTYCKRTPDGWWPMRTPLEMECEDDVSALVAALGWLVEHCDEMEKALRDYVVVHDVEGYVRRSKMLGPIARVLVGERLGRELETAERLLALGSSVAAKEDK